MAEKTSARKTQYRILRLTKVAVTLDSNNSTPQRTPETWELVAERVEASGARAAINLYANEHKDSLDGTNGFLAAIPASSFHVEPFGVRTETRVLIGAAAKK